MTIITTPIINEMLQLDQPDLYCSQGHLIPANAFISPTGAVVSEMVGRRVLMTSRLVCEVCARAAGGSLRQPRPPAKGHELDALGQQSLLSDDVPDLVIG